MLFRFFLFVVISLATSLAWAGDFRDFLRGDFQDDQVAWLHPGVYIAPPLFPVLSPAIGCANNCSTLPSLATINATPQGQASISSLTTSGGNVELVLSAPAQFANNGVYTISSATGLTTLNNDWRVTVLDATHVILNGSSSLTSSIGSYAGGGVMYFQYQPVAAFDEADGAIIGVNGPNDIYGAPTELSHYITIDGQTSDRAGIAKVVLYIDGASLTLTSRSWNSRTNDGGFVFNPIANASYNGPNTIYADVYPINGYVTRITLPIVLDNSVIAPAMTRSVRYVDYAAGSDPSNCTGAGTTQGTGVAPWKTIKHALGCASTTTNSADIIYVNPANSQVEDTNLNTVYPDNPNYAIVTSGTYNSGTGKPSPSTTKWTLTRANRYSTDNASAFYNVSANKVVLDRANIDMSKFSMLAAHTIGSDSGLLWISNAAISDPNGLSGPTNVSYSKTLDFSQNGLFLATSGYYFLTETTFSGQISASAELYRNINVTGSWDAFYAAKNLVSYTAADANGGIRGYRAFNHYVNNPALFFTRLHDYTSLSVNSITVDSTNNFSVVTFNPNYTSGGSNTITTTNGGTNYSISGNQLLAQTDFVGVSNGAGGYNWSRVNLSTTGPTNPTGTFFDQNIGVVTAQPYVTSQVSEQPPTLNIYSTDLHFTTGANGFVPDNTDTGTISQISVRTCDFHVYELSSGTNYPIAPSSTGNSSAVTVTGLTAQWASAAPGGASGPSTLYPNMVLVVGATSGIVASVTDSRTVQLQSGSTIPNGTYPAASNSTPVAGSWTANSGSVPEAVVQNDVTKGCAYTFTGFGTGGPGGTGTPGAGAVVGDNFVVWQRFHPDTMQFTILPNNYDNFNNFYMQNYHGQGLDVQPFFASQVFDEPGSGTVSISGKQATFSTPQTLNAGDLVNVTSGTYTHEFGILAAAISNSLSATFVAPVYADVSNVTWRHGKGVKNLACVNCVLTSKSRNGILSQFDTSMLNWMFIQSTIGVPDATNAVATTTIGSIRNANSRTGLYQFNLIDSIMYNLATDSGNTVPWLGGGPLQGFNGDNNCYLTSANSTAFGFNSSVCAGVTFDINFIPTGLTKTAVGQISGSATFGAPIFPWWSDGSVRGVSSVIGAVHP